MTLCGGLQNHPVRNAANIRGSLIVNRSRGAITPEQAHFAKRDVDASRRRSTSARRLSTSIFGAWLLASSAIAWASGGNPNPTVATFQPAAVTLTTAVGSTSSVTVSLFDSNSPPLSVSTITLSGPQSADYRLSGTCGAGTVVNRSVGPCSIIVNFTPGALGTRAATISATFGNAPAISVALNGQGIAPTPTTPRLHLDNVPASGIADFGPQPIGNDPTGVIPLPVLLMFMSDTGGANLIYTVQLIGTNSADFGFGPARNFNGGFCELITILNPQNVPCQLAVHFTPTALGTRTAIMRITSNDPTQPVFDLPLTGVGTPAIAAPAPPPPMGFTDITGLWGVATEPGWALSIYHHALAILGPSATDAVIAFWETYDTTGQAVWFELKDGRWSDQFTYTGNVHRFTGSPFTGPYVQSQLVDTIVGTATLHFTDGNTGTLNFSINGFTGVKSITRNPFAF
jgi:hypothetical protein